MPGSKREQLLTILESEGFKRRFRKARRFELLGGAGIEKKFKRAILLQSIYLPYVFYDKARASRLWLTPTTLFWGRPIRVSLQDYDALALFMFGFASGHDTELRLAKFFIKNLDKDDVFYDIGANWGFYTYLASELSEKVHAFEPLPKLATTIQKNVTKDPGVVVNRIALSDEVGETNLYLKESSGLSTINASAFELDSKAQQTSKKIVIKTTTLDEYVAHNPKPTYLKLDAEGAEKQIIMGGLEFFSSYSPIIALEIWGTSYQGDISMRAAEKLRELDYRSFRITEGGDLEEVTGDLSKTVSPTGGDNFIFKK